MILQRNNPANVRIDEYGGAEENYNLLKGDKNERTVREG